MIKDNIYIQKFNFVKLPRLKGKVKITLHNPTTGKNEIIEGENIVTNAVRDIMAANYMGSIDYKKMFPLWQKWYSGILCYQNPHPTTGGVIDPDDYYCYADEQNPLIAHAGSLIIDSEHDDDAKRGNPANLSFVFSDNSVKQVWEWTPSHGNGTISALSLTHRDTGNAGLGSDTYNFRNFNPFDEIGTLSRLDSLSATDKNSLFAQYDDNHGIQFFIGDNTGSSWEYTNGHICFETNEVTIFITKLPYKKAGLFETEFSKSEYSRVFKVETSIDFFANPCYYFDYETKYLWLFSNTTTSSVSGSSGWDKSNVNYTVIDCENEEEVTHGTIASDTANLAPLGSGRNTTSDWNASRQNFTGIAKQGNYIYLPTTNGITMGNSYFMNCTGFKKINISNQADQESISFNQMQPNYVTPMKYGELLVMSGRVVNSGIGYTCLDQLPHSSSDAAEQSKFATWLPNQFNTPSSVVFPLANFYGNPSSSFRDRRFFASKLVNTTKFNLPSSVIKSASQSMIIEYTLTEVAENE